MLRKKVESNEEELYALRSKFIEHGTQIPKSSEQIPKINEQSPELDYSVVTKKNIINIKNDLQNFKNEMRRSLSANESGIRERLSSMNRSIRHVQSRQTCQK